MLVESSLDGFIMVGGYPLAAIADTAAVFPITLLPIVGDRADAILEQHPFFTTSVIPAEVYAGVPRIETLGVGAQLVVAADMDEQLVYGITRALWDKSNRKLFVSGPPKAQRLQLNTALQSVAIPLHPGAARFYAETSAVDEENL